MWKVERQADDIQLLTMQFELQNAPYTFGCTKVSSVNVLFDLILTIMQAYGSTIPAFVEIFVDVLQGCEKHGAFNVYVTDEP